jgi:hypothetical protein
MPGFPLYQRHDQAFCSQYANVEQGAAAQPRVLVGAPGTIVEHDRGNAVYYYRQFMDAEGKRQQLSLGGPKGDAEADERVAAVTGQIEQAKDLISRIRELAKLGFQIADNKTYATMAVLYNHGLFQAGAVLVGSHAYAVLLNSLGIKAIAYETEDIDIARARQLALQNLPSTSCGKPASISCRCRRSTGAIRPRRSSRRARRVFTSICWCRRRTIRFQLLQCPNSARMRAGCRTSRICWASRIWAR